MSAVHIDDIDLNLLRYLLYLLEEKSVTRAAEQAGITQSAMSRALGRLRESFDDPLFVRSSDGLIPTARASKLEAGLRSALATIHEQVLAGVAFDPATDGTTLCLAAPDDVDVTLLAPAFEVARGEAPGIRAHFVGLPRGSISQALSEGSVDIAFSASRPRSPNIKGELLVKGGFMTLARKGHPALVGGELGIDEFLSYGHVLAAPQGDPEGPVDRTLQSLGWSRRIVAVVHSGLAAPLLVENSDLLCTLPDFTAGSLADRFGLEAVRTPLELPTMELWMSWHERQHADPAQRWFREHMRASREAAMKTPDRVKPGL